MGEHELEGDLSGDAVGACPVEARRHDLHVESAGDVEEEPRSERPDVPPLQVATQPLGPDPHRIEDEGQSDEERSGDVQEGHEDGGSGDGVR